LKTQFEDYRTIQLICCYTNVCFQKTIFLWVTVITIIMDIVTITSCLSYNASLPPRILVVLMRMSLNVNVITIFAYRFPGMLNKMSKEIVQEWKTIVQVKGRKWESRFAKSCQQLKIRFGEVNYFEESTCLTIVDFKFQQTINLKLISK